MSGRIAITPRSLSEHGHAALEPLTEAGYELVFPSPGRQPTEAELRAVLPGCVGYLAGVEPVGRALLEAASPTLRVISRNGVGTDAIDRAAAAEHGIAVRVAEGANAEGVAELAIALMLAATRHLPAADRAIKAGGWRRRAGVELRGRALGLVGAGRIGRRVAELALGLGMRVRAFDAFPDDGFRPRGDFAYAPLEDVLAGADVVSLHCPPAAEPLIGSRQIATMTPGALLINTARAGLVDEGAVLAALESGRLGGYATDVFVQEPPELTPLLLRDDVVTTPHVGGYTAESVDRAARAAVDNLLDELGRS